MNGIYGESLLAFPEQFRKVTVYEMTAKVNSGWTKTENTEETVLGIYQNGSGSRIKDSNGNLVESNGLEFWTKRNDLSGKFTTLEGDVYRLISSNNWNFEGGYAKYQMEKVNGNDGTEPINTAWNTGANNFS